MAAPPTSQNPFSTPSPSARSRLNCATDPPDFTNTRVGYDSFTYDLVFSDEFNISGRTFYPGDDPFWEAVDLWYGATGDIEWYDPSQYNPKWIDPGEYGTVHGGG
ncbi:hypothetical protein C0991_007351 [Blastosporella zonata]|nr:hypothetical protein C0991_007351 [Blastosporella zonata]